jgi:hypothetical protein
MPKIRCRCNFVIGLGQIPSPDQLMIISDAEFDKFAGLVDAEQIYSEMKVVAKCPNCGRIHIFWDGFDRPQAIYSREE